LAFYVYMLLCSDGSIYTGHTDDLDARLSAHQLGTFKGYTHERRPVRLIFHEAVNTRDDAFAMERRIKGWSRAKKLALAAGHWDLIRSLSRNHQGGSESETSRVVAKGKVVAPLIIRQAQDEREGASV
jgi:predicted GIY-YIG superfamily endonuclease